MPQVGTEEKFLFGEYCVTNHVDYKNSGFPTNKEILEIYYPIYEGQKNDFRNLKAGRKFIYPTYFSSVPT